MNSIQSHDLAATETPMTVSETRPQRTNLTCAALKLTFEIGYHLRAGAAWMSTCLFDTKDCALLLMIPTEAHTALVVTASANAGTTYS